MYAEYIDHMGTDLSVVNAARVSFDKVSEWVSTYEYVNSDEVQEEVLRLREDDAKLIKFLAKHYHWTPFAHTAISLRMKAPVPIRTQAFKHKAGLVENEESRRYIKSTPEVYMPKWRMAAANVKQGSGSDFGPDGCQQLTDWYAHATNEALMTYKEMLAVGVCPEQARFVLPQGCMVNWVWTGNLYAFANFYLKRTHPTAQREVKELAMTVANIIQPLFPVSWDALTKE